MVDGCIVDTLGVFENRLKVSDMRETGEKGTSIESTTNRDLILVHIFLNSVSLLSILEVSNGLSELDNCSTVNYDAIKKNLRLLKLNSIQLVLNLNVFKLIYLPKIISFARSFI